MLAQVEHQHASARHDDPRRLGQRAGRIGRMVQRLREERHVHARVAQRQLLELALLPDHVADAPASGERARALQDERRAIHRDDPGRPAARLDRQIPLAAPDVGHAQRRQKVAERARPGRPAPPRDELTLVGVRPGMRFEVLLAQPPHLGQPRIVRAAGLGRRGGGELGLEERGQRSRPVLPREKRRRGPEVGEAAFALLDDQPGILQQAEVPGHAGLGDPEDARQLAHVEPFGRQQAQNPQPGVVAEQLEQAGRLKHIYKSTSIDATWQRSPRLGTVPRRLERRGVWL